MTGADDRYCADAGRAAAAPLAGTASVARVWLLLEYAGPWRSDAVADNDLPPTVQAWLTAQTAAIPDSRVIFIKQPGSRRATVRFFLAVATEATRALYGWELNAYDMLHAIDAAGIVAGRVAATPLDVPLWLVCTNGKRDRCCARYGVGVFDALAAAAPEQVWQSTHLGGHRYAAVVAALPTGAYYGYMTPADASGLLAAAGNDDLYLPRLRGRTFYAPVVQAADCLLRHATGTAGAAAWRVTGSERGEDSAESATWHVTFSTPAGRQLRVTLAATTAGPELVSCSPAKLKPAPRFRYLGHSSAAEPAAAD